MLGNKKFILGHVECHVHGRYPKGDMRYKMYIYPIHTHICIIYNLQHIHMAQIIGVHKKKTKKSGEEIIKATFHENFQNGRMRVCRLKEFTKGPD